MRKLTTLLATAILLMVVPVATNAFADTAIGIIRMIDLETKVIVLDDEVEYMLPEEFDVEELDIGLRVQLEFEATTDANAVSQVNVVE